jgi:hypothetical protein
VREREGFVAGSVVVVVGGVVREREGFVGGPVVAVRIVLKLREGFAERSIVVTDEHTHGRRRREPD